MIIPEMLAITKQKFGRLTVLESKGVSPAGKRLWLCGCLCGNYTIVSTTQLMRTRRATRSCGTCYDEKRYPKEYNAYEGMHDRCYNANKKEYEHYGGRGITISQEWRQDFFNFFLDVGFAPGPEYSIDRINVNGNYEKGNVKWSTKKEQQNNMRSNWKNKLEL